MKTANPRFVAKLLALLFGTLFHKYESGLNLFIFDLAILLSLFHLDKSKFNSAAVKLFAAGSVLSSLLLILNGSAWPVFTHHLSLFLLGGALAMPELKSIHNHFFAAVFNIGLSIVSFFKRKITVRAGRSQRVWYVLRVSMIPILVVVLFGTLYSKASPWFGELWLSIRSFLWEIFGDIFQLLNIWWISSCIFGLFISAYLLFAKSYSYMENVELEQSEDLERKKKAKMFSFSSMALKREYTIAIVTFVALNLLILGQNILDVVYVWVGFEWKGEFLKQFVHKGTYVLIISILLSAALVLYYFRANLNFFEKNKALKILVYIWLAQNAFLALSVIARNIWYIQYFNLAYKRIGVFFFILAVGIGLVSVMMKVKHRKSVYYLLRKNLLAVYLIVLSIGVFNWDKIIAEYNFAHSDRSERNYIQL